MVASRDIRHVLLVSTTVRVCPNPHDGTTMTKTGVVLSDHTPPHPA